jgi:hypothetical protein
LHRLHTTTQVDMSTTVETTTDIRPFHVEISDKNFADLRRRVAETRLPSKELVADNSHGVELAILQEPTRYSSSDYDFGASRRD